MITDRIGLHSVLLPVLTAGLVISNDIFRYVIRLKLKLEVEHLHVANEIINKQNAGIVYQRARSCDGDWMKHSLPVTILSFSL